MKIYLGHHFYGAGNLGDDLMMAGFTRAWRERGLTAELTCATPFDRVALKARFPEIDWLPYDLQTRMQAIRNCTIWVGVGGPAFEADSGDWLVEHIAVELELCQRFRKPMFYLCAGVSNWRALEAPQNIAVLDYVEHIWTRDDAAAAERLRGICGDKVTAGADLSHLYLADRNWPDMRAGSLAWLMHFDDALAVRPDVVAQAIDALPQREHHWLVQEVRELAGSELATWHALAPAVRSRLDLAMPDYAAASTAQLLAHWPSCESVVTSRFHGALIAAWRGAGVAIIERNDKLAALARTLRCTSMSADYDVAALCRGVEASAPVERDVLLTQHEIARECCDEFFGQLKTHFSVAAPLLRATDGKDSRVMANGWPEASARGARHFLSADEIDRFHEQGFLGPFTALPVEEMRPHTQAICERVLSTPAPHSGYATENRHLDSSTVWSLCSQAAIVDRLVSLYGPDLIVWDSNIFDKGPAADGKPEEYPWHQDMWHWKLEPQMSLSVWLALTPATPENGCVEIIPGSHVSEIPIRQNNDSSLGSRFAGHSADPAYFDESSKVAMPLQPGQFFIFNEAVLHHSHPNCTEDRRIGLAFRVTMSRVKSDRDYPCLLLSGRDMYGHNTLAEPPLTDPCRSAQSLPDTQEISLSGPIDGLGWHLPENDKGIGFRWTGPQTSSWLDIAWWQPGAAILRCEILHAAAPQILTSLRIHVGEYPVALTWSQQGRLIVVEGHVPATALQPGTGMARVSLQLDVILRFCDMQVASDDTRWLGLAISQISLLPDENTPTEVPADCTTPDTSIKSAIPATLHPDRSCNEIAGTGP